MIGQLRGILLSKQPPALMLDVQGVGYELDAPMTTFYDLPKEGAELMLHTHLVVREDAQLLFGFSTENQRNLFRHLLKISGIGPRVGLAILSGLSVKEFRLCINGEDVVRLTKVPGIGRKTAERVILELRGKELPGMSADEDVAIAGSSNEIRSDAISALTALGYRVKDSEKVIGQLADQSDGSEGLSSESLIRQALQAMSGGPR
ncbi:Holliday junction ATP-dependent DNA helicase RuvA [bacterium BMS3Bbin11]|nr:Holliday junction ATP-dependent DNA helicase RuvA [bacterium BMS3Abin11]GBE45449.1 Holliday junction ATP-dependent DNA helicase RuvA [bacterium BMS3Bbin11]GMT41156.1 MAG: Holliday junction ATP-dependent DNA helicase RuvA [bacterium]HDH08011.1 Holliday junction branch migration protein RuvA [Gammaproteobacteria bacterium]HDH15827.1 Holliday junction branch migration protein RuvA [Gammaproteobacteria bacterium]